MDWGLARSWQLHTDKMRARPKHLALDGEPARSVPNSCMDPLCLARTCMLCFLPDGLKVQLLW